MRDPQSKLHHIYPYLSIETYGDLGIHHFQEIPILYQPYTMLLLSRPISPFCSQPSPRPVGPIGDRKEVHEVNQLVIHLHLNRAALWNSWWDMLEMYKRDVIHDENKYVGGLNMFKASISSYRSPQNPMVNHHVRGEKLAILWYKIHLNVASKLFTIKSGELHFLVQENSSTLS